MLHKLNTRPKKSLGQCFLKNQGVLDKIAESCLIDKKDTVLEIGPGHGELTRRLLSRAGRVVAVELDRALAEKLREDLGGQQNLSVVNADILKFEINDLLRECKPPLKVIGNIPYYITSPIIEHLFGYLDKIESINLTVQKEFARRMVSLPGSKEYGAFSCFVQYYTKARVLFYIRKGSFSPMPKVDSAFIQMQVRGEPLVRVRDERRLFSIIRTSFGQRRKMLSNSLKEAASAVLLKDFFSRYGVDPNARPEELSLQDFAHLSDLLV